MLDSSNLHSHISAYFLKLPSVLWHCWLGDRKLEWWGAGGVICLELGADLHMAQLMPLLLTVSCYSNIQIGFAFLVPAQLGSPGKRAVKRVCVCCPGLPRWVGIRKVKPIWISLEQEAVSSSGISWAICKSAPSSRQITMPAPHHSIFLQAGCPSCCPTNSVKALKAVVPDNYNYYNHLTASFPGQRG